MPARRARRGEKNEVVLYWICGDADRAVCRGRPHDGNGRWEVSAMPVIFAAAVMESAFECFAAGSILAGSVYLVSRGVKNPLRGKRK